MKKEFDKKFGTTWHCVVGRNFGSYVTHGTSLHPVLPPGAGLQLRADTDGRNASFHLFLYWPDRVPFVQVWVMLPWMEFGDLALRSGDILLF